MGRGLVEPIDDFRSSNPPTHPALLIELGRIPTIPALVTTIARSRAYGRTSVPPDAAGDAPRDDRFYSRALTKRLSAEVFVDAIALATGRPDAWPGRGADVTAIALGDVTVPSYRLDVCGRGRDDGSGSLARELHFLNGDGVLPKLDRGHAAAVARRRRTRPRALAAHAVAAARGGRDRAAYEQRWPRGRDARSPRTSCGRS